MVLMNRPGSGTRRQWPGDNFVDLILDDGLPRLSRVFRLPIRPAATRASYTPDELLSAFDGQSLSGPGH